MNNFDLLADQILHCQRCGLCQTRLNAVVGGGVMGAPVMLVGEAPGQQEDESGQPFVGRSGKLLDSLLQEAGLSRGQNVFISNIVKCRPQNNRNPLKPEVTACLPFLLEQIALCRPKIVVCLGRVAAQTLIAPSFKITQQHGELVEKEGILFTATLHPAAILRTPKYIETARVDWQKISTFAQ